jgi:hypothetical protein
MTRSLERDVIGSNRPGCPTRSFPPTGPAFGRPEDRLRREPSGPSARSLGPRFRGNER